MAFQKKPVSPYDPHAPINDYGSPSKGHTQFNYDRAAFAKRLDESRGCPPRDVLFRRISDTLVPNWFEWHSWTNRMVEAACTHRFIGVTGCCVAGHTKLSNPITGEDATIQYLCENKIAPIVMTLDGPTQANIPYIKGIADLFEVTLSNGSNFTSTSDHRVLTSQGYVFVKSLSLGQRLLAYAPTHRESTLERALSTREPDGLRCLGIVAGCSDRYSQGLHPCDAPLRPLKETYQSSFPLPACSPEHIHQSCSLDDLDTKFQHSLCPSFGHLSNRHSLNHRNSLDIPFLRLRGLENCERAFPLFQQPLRFRLGSDYRVPFAKPSHGFVNTRFACDTSVETFPPTSGTFLSVGNRRQSPSLCGEAMCSQLSFSEWSCVAIGMDSAFEPTDLNQGLSAWGYMVAQTEVVSIKKLRKDVFYDISVPGPEHYFAEGTIHHNSGAAKTRNMAGFACSWWLADPAHSSVIFCSTTMKMLRKRGWNEVQSYRNALVAAQGEDFGNFVDSRTVWQYDQGDDKHAIFCLAVQEGDVNKTAANIQGIHTRRQLVIIDEAPAVPSAIWKACANLYSYPIDSGGEFVMMAAGNPRSRIDQFGRFIEPANGWDSVSIETEEWEGKPQLDGSPTFVIRFDFCKSPNITEGKVVSKHLPTKHRVESRMASLKARGAEADADHYCYDRGFPAPEGMSKTVFTESMIVKHGGYDLHQFSGMTFQIIGAYDQARTGDRPALRFAAMGDIGGNKLGIEWMEPIILYSDAGSKDPIAYQQLAQVRKHCGAVRYRGQIYQCPPGNLGIDVSNEATFGDLCQREWSPDIIRVVFGSGASEEPASPEDTRPANEVYRNKRAEMFFRTRTCLESGQLKGIDKDTAAEMCSLEYSELRNDGTSKPITIQEKKEFKLKFGKSCDLIDAGVILTEVARLKGFRIVATGHTVARNQSFDKVVAMAQDVYKDADYTQQDDGQFTESDFVND